MRKGFLMVLAVALVAVLAAPAVAGTDINGFYRAKAYITNFDLPAYPTVGTTSTPGIDDDLPNGGYVEQRFRMRFSFGEENVKAIAFFEIDFSSWGDSAGSAGAAAARNSGGALGGDKINLETKNVYVWFKIPDTSLEFAVGLQNQTDSVQGLLYGAADMAGIFATGKFEPINWKLGWGKLYENSSTSWDDSNLYMGLVNYAPSKDVKLGFGVYFLQDDTQKTSSAAQLPYGTGNMFSNAGTRTAYQFDTGDHFTFNTWTFAVDFAWNAGPVALSGFGLYQMGDGKSVTDTTGQNDIDISGFAADVRADMKLGPGKFFLEVLYVSGGDLGNGDYGSIITLSDVNASPGGNSAFTRLDYQILMGNADDINQNQCIIGCANGIASSSPGNSGRGMWTAGAGYSMKAAEKVTLKVGAGYLQAVKTLDATSTGSATTIDAGRSKNMGTEVNANVNYNIMKGLDFGLYGAYAWLGDFLKATSSASGPDDAYTMFARLNYAF
jgi:hypothetical protein